MEPLVELGQIFMVEVCLNVCEKFFIGHHGKFVSSRESKQSALKVWKGVIQICMKPHINTSHACEKRGDSFLELVLSREVVFCLIRAMKTIVATQQKEILPCRRFACRKAIIDIHIDAEEELDGE